MSAEISHSFSRLPTANAHTWTPTKRQVAPIIRLFGAKSIGLKLVGVTAPDIGSSMETIDVNHDLRTFWHEDA